MSVARARRSFGVGAATCVVALNLVVSGSVPFATAVGATPSAIPSAPAAPVPRPESSAPPDPVRGAPATPDSGRLALTASDTRTIPQRLLAAGADPALGSAVTAVVIDTVTGAVIYSRNGSTVRLPASNQKLVTAFVALTTMGPNKTFPTVALVDTARTTVWLRGGGDPALSSAQLRTMATRVRDDLAGVGRQSIAVRVDDSLFPAPTNATGWKSSYLPGDVAPVRALVVDGHNVLDTGLDAGNSFAKELRAVGVAVPSVARQKLYRGGITVAKVTSPPVMTLVATMINSSNNDYAEALHRLSSLAAGSGATWSGANAHAMNVLRSRRVNVSNVAIQDGSGLSRSDRQSAATLTSLLLAVRRSWPTKYAIYRVNAMPTAGVSGTLRTRFATPDTACARGKVRAKTGWLSDVVSLSGTAYGVDGRERVFSIIENGAADPTQARFAIERFATAATGCNPG